MEVKSPITGGETRYIKSISTAEITKLYRRYSDVSRFFTNLPNVELYECADTGYRFYYPFTVAGDGPFYEDLSREPLYYVAWKNEHAIADTYIQTGNKVLEQGCATGSFLKREQETKKIVPYGTELNDEAKSQAEKLGINFEKITDADVVCSFQVLEHIADVRSFVEEAIAAAKPGGYIIFAVPNNDSFMKDDPRGFLNMPPHHMGIWTKSVFESFPTFFPLELVATHTEELQPLHYPYYYHRVFGERLLPLKFFGRVLNKIIFEILGKHLIARKAATITGHTLLAVFKKK